MAAFALALLLSSAAALPSPQLAEPGGQVTLRADLGEVIASEDLVRAEGGATIESGGLLLRADLLEYDLAERQASASGQVLFVDGNVVTLAEEGRFSLRGERPLWLRDGTLLIKSAAQAPSAYRSIDAAAARALGQNALTLRADELERVARSRFVARGLEMTSCDTAEGGCAPWSLGASSADLEIGERALLRWPTFRVRGVPLLVLPALYVPLSDRRTGLLMTQVSFNRGTLIVEQPFFLTLGRSWDLTLAGGWRWAGEEQRPHGARGSAELRYAPAQSTSGRLAVAGQNDRQPVAGEPFGGRGQLTWRHATSLESLEAQADVRLVSDERYLGDEATDFLRSQVNYLRSQVRGAWRGERAVLSVSSGWYQPIEPYSATAANPRQRLFGAEAPVSFQRPVALRLDLPSLRIAGPVRGGLEVAASHYRPIAPGGPVDEARLLGSFGARPLTLSRLDLRPSLSAALLGSGPVRAEAYAAARADLSHYAPALGEGGSSSGAWGRAVAGLWAGTELSRSFGEGAQALRHTIAPRLELRGSTRELGERPAFDDGWVPPVDEYDATHRTPTARLLQGIASVRTRLARRGGELARLELGQAWDFAARQPGDAFGEVGFSRGWISGSARARFDPVLGEFSTVGAGLRLADTRGDGLTASYDRLLGGGSSLMRAGLDDLFGPPGAASPLLLQQVSADATVVPFRGASLRYGITVGPGREPEPVLQHRLGLTLGGAGDCWRLALTAVIQPLVVNGAVTEWPWSFGVTLDLKNLGSFGS